MMPWAPSDQSCKTTPWVFTKGTGEPPCWPVPSFYPFQRNRFQQGAQIGGRPVSTPVERRRLGSPPARAEDSGVPSFSLGAVPVRPEPTLFTRGPDRPHFQAESGETDV